MTWLGSWLFISGLSDEAQLKIINFGAEWHGWAQDYKFRGRVTWLGWGPAALNYAAGPAPILIPMLPPRPLKFPWEKGKRRNQYNTRIVPSSSFLFRDKHLIPSSSFLFRDKHLILVQMCSVNKDIFNSLYMEGIVVWMYGLRTRPFPIRHACIIKDR